MAEVKDLVRQRVRNMVLRSLGEGVTDEFSDSVKLRKVGHRGVVYVMYGAGETATVFHAWRGVERLFVVERVEAPQAGVVSAVAVLPASRLPAAQRVFDLVMSIGEKCEVVISQGSADAVERDRKRVLKALESAVVDGKSNSVVRNVAWGAVAFLAVGMLLAPRPAQVGAQLAAAQAQTASAGLPRAGGGVAVEAAPPQESMRLSGESMTQLAKQGAFINLAGEQATGKPFFVFADPLCPACRDLESVIEKLAAKGYRPTVVPVAFRKRDGVENHPGAEERAAAALCATTDEERRKIWSAAVGTGFSASACEAGLAQVRKNTELFLSYGFRYTPTVLSVVGDPAVASEGGLTEEAIKGWVDSHTPAVFK